MTASRTPQRGATPAPTTAPASTRAPSGGGTPAPTSGARDGLQSDLRQSSYDEGAARLAPPPAAPGAAAAAAPIADQVPQNVDLKSARVSFTMPAGKKLAGSFAYEAKTQYATTVTIEASPTELRVWTSPGLHFDVQWPGQNMRFSSAGVNFASGQPFANFYLEGGLGSGFIDVSERGANEVRSMITQAIAGSAMARPGYNPMQDRDLIGTMNRIKSNFDRLPSGSGNQVGAQDLTSPTIGASLGMKSPFLQEADGAGIEIPAGGTLDVSIAGNANLARLLQAGNPQAAAMAANIQHIAVNSDAITLQHKGKPIAKLLSLRVLRGGQVTLDRFEMLGGLGAGAGFESLLRIIVGTIALAERGVPPQIGAQVTVGSGNAEPELVRGVSRQMIEQGLSSAVQKLLRDNRNAVPGLDLGLVFGV